MPPPELSARDRVHIFLLTFLELLDPLTTLRGELHRFLGTQEYAEFMGAPSDWLELYSRGVGFQAVCNRCKRPYAPEVQDWGLCCICFRDLAYELVYGKEWRKRVYPLRTEEAQPC